MPGLHSKNPPATADMQRGDTAKLTRQAQAPALTAILSPRPTKAPMTPAVLLPAARSSTPRPPHISRSLTLDEDFFERRELRRNCTQYRPTEDFVPQASEIIPGLYLADMYTATSPATLSFHGITHVITVLRESFLAFPGSVEVLQVPVDDFATANILRYLQNTVEAVDKVLRDGGTVLVHCMWGMSRSASVVMAYLMSKRQMSLSRAWAYVRARRSIIHPNRGFMQQLGLYEKKLQMLRWRTMEQPIHPVAPRAEACAVKAGENEDS